MVNSSGWYNRLGDYSKSLFNNQNSLAKPITQVAIGALSLAIGYFLYQFFNSNMAVSAEPISPPPEVLPMDLTNHNMSPEESLLPAIRDVVAGILGTGIGLYLMNSRSDKQAVPSSESQIENQEDEPSTELEDLSEEEKDRIEEEKAAREYMKYRDDDDLYLGKIEDVYKGLGEITAGGVFANRPLLGKFPAILTDIRNINEASAKKDYSYAVQVLCRHIRDVSDKFRDVTQEELDDLKNLIQGEDKKDYFSHRLKVLRIRRAL